MALIGIVLIRWMRMVMNFSVQEDGIHVSWQTDWQVSILYFSLWLQRRGWGVSTGCLWMWWTTECQQQLYTCKVRIWVSGKSYDQEYFIRLCDSSLELGYEDITCSNTSEIIYVDLLTYETSCGPVRTNYKEDCITIIDYKQFRMMEDVQEHLKLDVIQKHLLSHLRINVTQQL